MRIHGRVTLLVRVHLRAVAGAIWRDAQVESALRRNGEALGIGEDSRLGRALREEDVGQALGQSLERGLRQRGQGMER